MFIFYLLIGIGVLLVVYGTMRSFTQANPRSLATALRWTAIAGGAAVALWLLATGRLNQALMMGAALLPLFMRWKAIFANMRNARGPAAGQSSDVETAWLRMSLDHDTGAMDGIVLQGAWKGRRLSELSNDALLDLLTECRVQDPDSAQLVEAYLDRVRPDWRAGAAGAQTDQRTEAPRATAAMSREEACRILDVPPDADADTIREAHRRLMMKVHPDVGGSSYLAAKINQAKDVLLGS